MVMLAAVMGVLLASVAIAIAAQQFSRRQTDQVALLKSLGASAPLVPLYHLARVRASAEVADTRRARRRGLLGRDDLDGALVMERCRWIHTLGMRFAIDVAYLDDDGIVVKTMHMNRFRIGVPVWRASWVIEAEGGAFGRWGLRVGDEVELRAKDAGGAAGSNGGPP